MHKEKISTKKSPNNSSIAAGKAKESSKQFTTISQESLLLDKFRQTLSATFCDQAKNLINEHPIVKGNAYTKWFSRGEVSPEQLRHFTIQFSVFGHLFIQSQLMKCINAPDLESYRSGKEILLNELGITFTKNGTIEGGRFKFGAAHFEWMLEFAKHLDLRFEQIGKRHHGSKSTLICSDELLKWYGSDDLSTAAGASHAIEHWAAAGFWKELIAGLKIIKANQIPDLPLGFWVWHDMLEDQHAAHTDSELESICTKTDFSEAAFLEGAKAVLNAIAVFWNGLEADRKSLAKKQRILVLP